jgi:hypothetical protein
MTVDVQLQRLGPRPGQLRQIAKQTDSIPAEMVLYGLGN